MHPLGVVVVVVVVLNAFNSSECYFYSVLNLSAMTIAGITTTTSSSTITTIKSSYSTTISLKWNLCAAQFKVEHFPVVINGNFYFLY